MTEMAQAPRWLTRGLAVLAVAGLALPMILYWLLVARVPSMTPAEAWAQLSEQPESTALVDVCPARQYAEQHLEMAVSWPAGEILGLAGPDEIPPELRGRRLLLICRAGIASALAVPPLRRLDVDAVNVREGLSGWIAATALDPDSAPPIRLIQNGCPLPPEALWRSSPPLEQWVAVLTAFVVKPLYMALALALAVWLRRHREADVVALRRSMLAFFAGEAFCALNYLLFAEQSHLGELLHQYGMALAFGFVTFAVIASVDSRLLHLSHPTVRCGALELCGGCVKHGAPTCRLERAFLAVILAIAALNLMLLCAEPQAVSYNTHILGGAYNYSHSPLYQIFEIRLCPLYGSLLLAASFITLLAGGRRGLAPSKVLFAAGLGPTGFGLFRLVLFGPFRDDLVWFQSWEELTELLFVAAAVWIVWVFRDRLK